MDTTSEFHVKYLDIMKKWYIEKGFKKNNVKIFNMKTDKLPVLDNLDVLHMWGGNTFHYLQRIKETGLDSKIRGFIERGGVYIGSSAGRMVMCPDVDENLTADFNDIGSTDLTGLGFIDFNIVVHWDTKGDDSHTRVINYIWKSGKRVVALTDNQAIVVNGTGFKIISP